MTEVAARESAGLRRWTVVGVLSMCVLVPFMDVTMISIDLPKIAAALHASPGQLQWIVISYIVACASGMLLVPALGGRWGQRRTLVTGLVVFGAASLAAAYATDVGWLLLWRVVMGAGASVVLPMRVSITTGLFPPEQRRRAFGIGTAVVASATPLGPILGGALLEHSWWGSVFLINTGLVVLACPLLLVLVPEARAEQPHRADVAGVALAGAAVLAISAGLIDAAGGGRAWAAAWLALAAVLVIAFGVRQRRAEHPLIELSVLRVPRFVWSQLVIVLANLAWTGAMFVVPMYLETRLGVDPLGVGLRLLPFAGFVAVSSLLSDRVARRVGVRWVVIAGLLVFAAGLALLAFAVSAGDDALITVALGVAGFGGGIPQAPALSAAMGSLPPKSARNGAGFINALRHFGGAFGVLAVGLVTVPAGALAERTGPAVLVLAVLLVFAAVLVVALPERAE
ncbi:MFS transporter [Amycolatopsis sp. DG1A-15b]|uniref:MFS transporter n=1 Tax=Amycolatopsis sp. DG1A-15b TaxID=3052846 RepID=UPI00255BE7AC|nr:MFS transporter [Amycolatopsis sp. DG1A-15b]WIX91752.1 MFS transporter [Amycolatopsis sp. DG1A-15b]